MLYLVASDKRNVHVYQGRNNVSVTNKTIILPVVLYWCETWCLTQKGVYT